MNNVIVMKGKPRMILKAYCNLMEMPLVSSGLTHVAHSEITTNHSLPPT